MTSTFKKKAVYRIAELSKIIHRHNFFYYIQNKPKIADIEYDKLVNELITLEKKFPDLKLFNSPTQIIETPKKNFFPQIIHYKPMLSLESGSDFNLIQKFFCRLDEIREKKTLLLAQPKIDGLSVELVYESGLLKTGSTRGNGLKGEDITLNIQTIADIPQSLINCSEPQIIVRGEVYMSLNNFDKLNHKLIQHGIEPFATPRNAASGSLRQLNKKIIAQRSLNFFPFELVNAHEIGLLSDFQSLTFLSCLGLPIEKKYIYQGYSISFVQELYTKFMYQREKLPFEIDGLVIKIDNLSLRRRMGSRLRSPRWAIAWKFLPREEITSVRKIIIQVGRTGKLTPVVLLMPVNISGVTVSRATLHNFNQMHKLEINIGDIVRIARAGDVIPKVIKVEKRKSSENTKFIVPIYCPVCKSKIIQKGAYLFCPNTLGCKAQLLGAIRHYVGREAMNIKGLGIKRIATLIDLGLLTSISSIYCLAQYKETLIQLEGWNKILVNNILASIEKKRNVSLESFIYALGIPNVGLSTARELAKHFSSIKNLIHVSQLKLIKIEGIGPLVAKQILTFFSQSRNINIIFSLEREIHLISLFQSNYLTNPLISQKLAQQTIVFTGTLQTMSKLQAETLVSQLGGKTSRNISIKTNLVVAGLKFGLKVNKARSLGIRVINEFEFLDMIKD